MSNVSRLTASEIAAGLAACEALKIEPPAPWKVKKNPRYLAHRVEAKSGDVLVSLCTFEVGTFLALARDLLPRALRELEAQADARLADTEGLAESLYNDDLSLREGSFLQWAHVRGIVRERYLRRARAVQAWVRERTEP